MKTKSSELCSECRNIPCNNRLGSTLGEMADTINNDQRLKGLSDDDANSALFSVLYDYADVWHCTSCWQLISDRLPSHMKER